jgi:hypothetical protein
LTKTGSTRVLSVFLGRAAKVVAVLVVSLLVYAALLSFFLRFGPSGLGPRLFQLGLALALPAALTYRTLWKRRGRFSVWKPIAGLTAASLLTPSLLEPAPLLSLAASVALGATPYYLPNHLPRLFKHTLRRAGRTDEDGGSRARLDLLLLKRHVYYFRWWGPGFPDRAGTQIVRASGQEYLRVRRTAFSDETCRRKALARALEVAKSVPGVIVPATEEEVSCLEWGKELEERVLAAAKAEREALAPLVIAGKRRLTCALEGSTGGTASAADVVLRNDGEFATVKLLSGRAVAMEPQRLRDLLDVYEMVVAGE